ncbi:MAG: CBS domain-containing protein [Sandaracinaceae bacterium]|nr:CBS domain-containing protein [Sandaracinaceae bacterium]
MNIDAEELMTAEVVTVSEDTPLSAALEIMQEHDIRHLPVVRGKRLVGMLSDRDLQGLGLRLAVDMETLDRLESKLRAKVKTAMSSHLVTVHPSSDVAEIIDRLVEERIGAVPVVEEDELVGIVSYVDVLRAVRDGL